MAPKGPESSTLDRSGGTIPGSKRPQAFDPSHSSQGFRPATQLWKVAATRRCAYASSGEQDQSFYLGRGGDFDPS